MSETEMALIAAASQMYEACMALERWSRDKEGGAPGDALECWTPDLQDAVMSGRRALAVVQIELLMGIAED